MNRLYKAVLSILLFLTAAVSFAQKGTIRGTVIDDATGETLIGVTVIIKGTTNGGITDFDGNFEISVEPGAHDITASYVSYATITIASVNVEAGQVTVIDQIRLQEDVQQLEEIVIQAEVINTTETALMTLKRKSPNVMDGISAASFRKIGDSDAADAVKRVTGVSVEGGKYVYVRGLGDRYTKTMMNNMDIPGLDPDRNSIQIDIFPTNLIDNMVVLKSFAPELPADFTGGIINIETKDFPEERILDLSIKGAYNPSMHFKSDYITYPGSNTDQFGFDNGARKLPDRARTEPIPSPVSGDSESEVFDFLNSFNKTLGPTRETNFMNYSLGLTFADQINVGKSDNKLGFILTGTYKNDNVFYDDVSFGEYQRAAPPTDENEPDTDYELVKATTQDGILTEHNVLLGGLAGIAYKADRSKYKLNVMHLQNGESRSAQLELFDDGAVPGKSGFIGFSNNLEYNQRALTNFFVNGAHFNEDASWKVDWRASATFSSLDDPDIRKTAYTINRATGDSVFVAGAAGNPSRIWRELDEVNVMGKVDVTREHQLFSRSARLKFGASYTYKERDYQILSYQNQFFGIQPPTGGDPNKVLLEDNLWPNGTVYYNSGNNDPNPNQYNSNAFNAAAYISDEFNPSERLKAIIGLRSEYFVQRHTGRDAIFANSGTEGNNLDNEKVLDSFDLFPLLNLIFSLKDNQNLRFSFSRTIARPSFKELSFAQIIDPVSNRIFNGGLFPYEGDWDGNLTETRISNFDLRWELFLKGGQLFSVSAFYKTFTDPIELVRIPAALTTNEFQPRNVGNSYLYGAELEFRKSLSFVSEGLSKLAVNGNITVVQSSLEMNDAEFRARKSFEKEGETIENTREMAGQAPYIINAGLSYNDATAGLDAGFFYNVKGRTLSVVGGGLFPDVYAIPFHSLNFNLNKSFGAQRRSSVSLNVTNILGDIREEMYGAYNAADQVFYRFNPGTEIGVGFKYSF
jgi:outer membrane receptor protein involved in Fe transport